MKTIIVCFALFLTVMVSCKKGGEGGEDPVTSETVLINSPDPKVYLSGEFPAVYIKWAGSHVPSIEGQDWAFTPDPKAITGNYKLIIEPNGSDSLSLYLDGSGTGPSFQKTPIGSFSYANFSGNSTNAAGYQYGVWYLQDRFSAPGNIRVMVERLAFPTKTDFRFRVNIAYVYGTSSPYVGRYMPYINDVAGITVNDIRQVGSFIFARESPGVLK